MLSITSSVKLRSSLGTLYATLWNRRGYHRAAAVRGPHNFPQVGPLSKQCLTKRMPNIARISSSSSQLLRNAPMGYRNFWNPVAHFMSLLIKAKVY